MPANTVSAQAISRVRCGRKAGANRERMAIKKNVTSRLARPPRKKICGSSELNRNGKRTEKYEKRMNAYTLICTSGRKRTWRNTSFEAMRIATAARIGQLTEKAPLNQ